MIEEDKLKTQIWFKVLNERLNNDSLKSLCFSLGFLKYDNLSGDNLESRIISFLKHNLEKDHYKLFESFLETSERWQYLNDAFLSERFGIEFRNLDLLEPDSSPYKGMFSYREADAPLFFGREKLSEELFNQILEIKNQPNLENFLAIIGASGCGKSSIVQAGIIPQLRKSGLPIYLMTPTTDPIESLAIELTRDEESTRATEVLVEDLIESKQTLHYCIRRNFDPERTLILVIDQFEELFTLCDSQQLREKFVSNLLFALKKMNNSLFILITLRADFYHRVAWSDELRRLVQSHQRYIGLMTREELERAIKGPAFAKKLKIERGLVKQILDDVGNEPGSTPLLSHAMYETWKLSENNLLTREAYYESGQVKGAIAKTAQGEYEKLTQKKQKIARNIFLRLTQLGDGSEDTRRRAHVNEFVNSHTDPREVVEVLGTLVNTRLITVDKTQVDVSHEALIREWGLLREWLEEDRESLKILEQINQAARFWNTNGRKEEDLYSGTRLTNTQSWVEESSLPLSNLEDQFLYASLKKYEDDRFAEQKAKLLSMLYDAIEKMSSTFEVSRIIQLVTEHIIEMIDIDACAYIDRPHKSSELVGQIMYKGNKRLAEMPIQVQNYIKASPLFENIWVNPRQIQINTNDPGLDETNRKMLKRLEVFSLLVMPLTTTSGIIGTVLVMDRSEARAFHSEEISTVGTLCNQAAVSIQNARSYAETQRQLNVTNLLNEASKVINSSLDLEEIMKSLLEQMNSFLHVEALSIALVDRVTGELVYTVAEGIGSTQIVGLRMPSNEGIAGWVAEHGSPAMVNDTHNDPRFITTGDQRTGHHTFATIVAPMQVKGKVLGTIQAINPTMRQHFTEEDLILLVNLANLASSAVANAQQFTRTQKAESRYIGLFQDSIDPIILTDRRGHVIEANNRANDLFDLEREVMLVKHINDLHTVDTGAMGERQFKAIKTRQIKMFNSEIVSEVTGKKTVVEVYAKRLFVNSEDRLQDRQVLQWTYHDTTRDYAFREIQNLAIVRFYKLVSGFLNSIESAQKENLDFNSVFVLQSFVNRLSNLSKGLNSNRTKIKLIDLAAQLNEYFGQVNSNWDAVKFSNNFDSECIVEINSNLYREALIILMGLFLDDSPQTLRIEFSILNNEELLIKFSNQQMNESFLLGIAKQINDDEGSVKNSEIDFLKRLLDFVDIKIRIKAPVEQEIEVFLPMTILRAEGDKDNNSNVENVIGLLFD